RPAGSRKRCGIAVAFGASASAITLTIVEPRVIAGPGGRSRTKGQGIVVRTRQISQDANVAGGRREAFETDTLVVATAQALSNERAVLAVDLEIEVAFRVDEFETQAEEPRGGNDGTVVVVVGTDRRRGDFVRQNI